MIRIRVQDLISDQNTLSNPRSFFSPYQISYIYLLSTRRHVWFLQLPQFDSLSIPYVFSRGAELHPGSLVASNLSSCSFLALTYLDSNSVLFLLRVVRIYYRCWSFSSRRRGIITVEEVK